MRHRNLVALKGFCVTSTDCFLILDFAAGGNLDQALRSREYPLIACYMFLVSPRGFA